MSNDPIAGDLTASRLGRWLPFLAVMAVAITAGIHFFAFISDYAVNLLFYDQWEFLDPVFQAHPGLKELFLFQLGPHREGLGLIVDSILYPWSGWNTRAESFLIGGCVFAAMLLALLLKYRLFGKLSFADAAIPLIFLTLAQYETFTGTPNAAYSGLPLLMMMLYCHALLARRYPIRFALCLGLNFLLIFTGFGVFMGVVTLGVFALECYWRVRRMSEVPVWASLSGLAAAGVSLGLFFVRYAFQPAVDCFVFPDPHLSGYPRFLAVMAARFFGLISPVRIAEAAGICAVVCAAGMAGALAVRLLRGNGQRSVQLVAGVLLSYTALFTVNTAVGRVCLGIIAAQAPRYMTLLIPGAFGCYLFLRTVSPEGIRRGLSLVFLLLLLPGNAIVDDGADWFADGKRAWAECYVRTEDIAGCDRSASFVNDPTPERVRMKEKLDYLKEHRLNLFSGIRQ